MNVIGQHNKDQKLILAISPGSRMPIYEQLCAQIRAAIGAKTLVSGQRLPTMRAVALDSKVDLNTVQKAYRELEREGFLITQGTRGTFVADMPPFADPSLREAQTRALAQETVAAARIQGLDPKEVAEAVLHICTQAAENDHV